MFTGNSKTEKKDPNLCLKIRIFHEEYFHLTGHTGIEDWVTTLIGKVKVEKLLRNFFLKSKLDKFYRMVWMRGESMNPTSAMFLSLVKFEYSVNKVFSNAPFFIWKNSKIQCTKQNKKSIWKMPTFVISFQIQALYWKVLLPIQVTIMKNIYDNYHIKNDIWENVEFNKQLLITKFEQQCNWIRWPFHKEKKI